MCPLDGDPDKSMDIIAHPTAPRGQGRGCALVLSRDGKYVFTAGGPDSCVHMWCLNTE